MQEFNKNINYCVMKVSRGYDGIKFLENTFNQEQQNVVVTKIVTGTPKGEYMKNIQVSDISYIQYLRGTSDEALILIAGIPNDDLIDNILFTVPVQEFFALNDHLNINMEKPTIETSLQYLTQFDNLTGLLFSIFSTIKMVILGSNSHNLTAITHLMNLLPPSVAQHQSFHTFGEQLDPSIEWFGMPPTEDSTRQLEGLEFSHCFLSLPKNKAVSPYECDLTNELADLIYTNEIDEAINIIESIYQSSNQIQQMSDVSEIADKLSINISDAEFLQKVASTHNLQRIVHPTNWRF